MVEDDGAKPTWWYGVLYTYTPLVQTSLTRALLHVYQFNVMGGSRAAQYPKRYRAAMNKNVFMFDMRKNHIMTEIRRTNADVIVLVRV